MSLRNTTASPSPANLHATQVLDANPDGSVQVRMGNEPLDQVFRKIYEDVEGGGYFLAKWLLMHAEDGTLPQAGATLSLPAMEALIAESALASAAIDKQARSMFPDGFSGGYRQQLRATHHQQRKALQGSSLAGGLGAPQPRRGRTKLKPRAEGASQLAKSQPSPRVALAHGLRAELQARKARAEGRTPSQVADLSKPANIALGMVDRLGRGDMGRLLSAFPSRQSFVDFLTAQARPLVGSQSEAKDIADEMAHRFAGVLKHSAVLDPVARALRTNIDHGTIALQALAKDAHFREALVVNLWNMSDAQLEPFIRTAHLDHLIDRATMRKLGPKGFERHIQAQAEKVLERLLDFKNKANSRTFDVLKIAPHITAQTIRWESFGLPAEAGFNPHAFKPTTFAQAEILSMQRKLVPNPSFWKSVLNNFLSAKNWTEIAGAMAFPLAAIPIAVLDGALGGVYNYDRAVALHAAQMGQSSDIRAAVVHSLVDIGTGLAIKGAAGALSRSVGTVMAVGGQEAAQRVATKAALGGAMVTVKAFVKAGKKAIKENVRELVAKQAAHNLVEFTMDGSRGSAANHPFEDVVLDDATAHQYAAQLNFGRLALQKIPEARRALQRAFSNADVELGGQSFEQLTDLFCLVMGPSIGRLATDGQLEEAFAAFLQEYAALDD